ncbi:MAG: hypothetical protein RL367_2252 [Pseudomonadota bacterium]
MRRFYKQVAVTSLAKDLFGIVLDDRPVKTPAKAMLAVASQTLATAMADEWRAQGDVINPHAMPFTGLANAAIDHVGPDPMVFATALAAYAESELLCYRATEDQADLATRQDQIWGPLLDWARQRYDVSFTIVTGIIHQPQPQKTLARLRDAVAAQPAFVLAALQPIITITGSCVIGLALAEGHLTGEAAFDAAHLDELWQEENWGADHFALETRNAHRADMMAAVQFMALLG